MKKVIIFIICLVSFSYTTKAFLGEDLGSDLYNNIDEGYAEIKLKQYEYELSGQGEGIKENINNVLELEGFGGCIETELDVSVAEEIALGNVENLYDIISDECKGEDGTISVDKISGIQSTIKKLYEISKYKGEEKSKQTNNISRVGIYSDGSRENSPFDLISDLEDIDKIIFTDEIVYEGEEVSNNDNIFEDLINSEFDSDLHSNSIYESCTYTAVEIINDYEENCSYETDSIAAIRYRAVGRCGSKEGIDYWNNSYNLGHRYDIFLEAYTGTCPIAQNINDNVTQTCNNENLCLPGDTYLTRQGLCVNNYCSDDVGNDTEDISGNNNEGEDVPGNEGNGSDTDSENCVTYNEETGLNDESGLSAESLNNLLSNDFDGDSISDGTSGISDTDTEGDDLSNGTDAIGGYKSVNDNSQWPCETFFCITIDFITYTHDLLGGGQNMSIEYLINRSNDHLKTFAATSLMQATMSINNFEFSLKDVNLPDMFHMGVVISSKPIPILEIEPEEEDDDDEESKNKFTSENLLREYYKDIGLEYERRNDLTIFEAKEKELKTVIDSAALSNYDLIEKLKNLKKFKNTKDGKSEFVSQTVLKKVGNDELSNFEKQFLELRKFSSSIQEYVISIDGIIRQMNKIPIEN